MFIRLATLAVIFNKKYYTSEVLFKAFTTEDETNPVISATDFDFDFKERRSSSSPSQSDSTLRQYLRAAAAPSTDPHPPTYLYLSFISINKGISVIGKLLEILLPLRAIVCTSNTDTISWNVGRQVGRQVSRKVGWGRWDSSQWSK